jgi:hypothetical protein
MKYIKLVILLAMVIIISIAVHEGVHYILAQESQGQVEDICLLGQGKDEDGQVYVGWVTVSNYSNTRDYYTLRMRGIQNNEQWIAIIIQILFAVGLFYYMAWEYLEFGKIKEQEK